MDARKINNQIFVQNLKSFRGINGISQKRLAELIGIHKSTIHQYENGNTHGIAKHKYIIEKIFNCSIVDLFDKDLRNIWKVDERLANDNTKHNRLTITFQGKTLSVQKWARILNIKEMTIYNRIRKGYSVEKVLSSDRVICHSKEITYNNMTMTVSQWAEAYGIKAATLYRRLRNEVTFEQAIQTGYIRYPK